MSEGFKDCPNCGEVTSYATGQCEVCHAHLPSLELGKRWEYGKARYRTPKRRGFILTAWICFLGTLVPQSILPLAGTLFPLVAIGGVLLALVLVNSGDLTARIHGWILVTSYAGILTGSIIARILIATGIY